MDERELVIKSEDKEDLVSKTKTIYDTKASEIFWKNFLAGFSRSLGGIFVYIIFLLIFSGVFVNFVLPKLTPLINNYLNIFNSLGPISNPKPGTDIILPQNLDLQKLFKQ